MKNIYREILSLTEEDITEHLAADESEFEDADENGYSAEELEWIDFVKSKLSVKQRAFVDYFKEVIDKDKNPDHGFDRYLVFLGVLDLFDRKPEFCPDASLDFLKHTVRHKKFKDDYAEIIEIMNVWSDNVRASKKPATRRAARMSLLPKMILYPGFVLVLSLKISFSLHSALNSTLHVLQLLFLWMLVKVLMMILTVLNVL